MRNVHIDYHGPQLDYQTACFIAKDTARRNQMHDPTIISWYLSGANDMAPYFDGANPETWWAKYGAGNGGNLEVVIGEDYHFIIIDTQGYDQVGHLPLRNLSDEHSNHYLCYTPILGRVADKPNREACIHLDGWAADQL
jgi:hypothetical protein